MKYNDLLKKLRKSGHCVEPTKKGDMVLHKNGTNKVWMDEPHGSNYEGKMKGILGNLKKNGFDY